VHSIKQIKNEQKKRISNHRNLSFDGLHRIHGRNGTEDAIGLFPKHLGVSDGLVVFCHFISWQVFQIEEIGRGRDLISIQNQFISTKIIQSIMKKYLLILLLPILLFCCDDDDNTTPEDLTGPCLSETSVEFSNTSCESNFSNDDCEVIHIGSKDLSENVKTDFVDFCNTTESELLFEDPDGNTITCYILEKSFRKNVYQIVSNFNTADCKRYCLDNEEAVVVLASDKFSLRIVLVTGLEFGINDMNSEEKINTSFSIFAMKENTRQIIFDLPVEDFFDEPIVPDTTTIRHHESITLNNSSYTDVYSNENNLNTPGLERKEKVYFHSKNGLIAVRDSLGVLWTRQ